MSRPSQLSELRQRIRLDLRDTGVEQTVVDDLVLAANEVVSMTLRTDATERPRRITVQWTVSGGPRRVARVSVSTPDDVELDANDSVVRNMLRELAEQLNVDTLIGGTVIRLSKSVQGHDFVSS